MRFFGRRYRCIAYAARGYPPSDVPQSVASYSQERAALDIGAVMDGAGIERAHVVGLSMGGFATLHFGLDHPGRALSLVAAGEYRPSLLLSDVVMPRMSGPELADRLKKMLPTLIVLYMSGYPKNVVLQDGLLAPSMKLISKPFSTAALIAFVREALDAE